MKKKFLIISASISLLLVCFPFTLCAEDAPASDPGDPPASLTPGLDNYFYSNYDLLPYVESNGNQYIDTGVKPSSNLSIRCKVSGLSQNGFIYGSRTSFGNNDYSLYYSNTNDEISFRYFVNNSAASGHISPYSLFNLYFDQNVAYINGDLIHEFSNSSYSSDLNIYIFNVNNNGSISPGYEGRFKLHYLYIYDYSANDGEGAYLKYYYPAKAKSGGTIGLYDAVSKTFVTTSGQTPFSSPTDDKVIHFQIGTFITAGLGWIGDILDYAISEPVILLFMAIGLAGATFRWARRLVHF